MKPLLAYNSAILLLYILNESRPLFSICGGEATWVFLRGTQLYMKSSETKYGRVILKGILILFFPLDCGEV